MSSKIPGFTSGLKAPSASSQLPSLLKRRGNETTSAAATTATAEKRARTTDDAQMGTEFNSRLYETFHHLLIS